MIAAWHDREIAAATRGLFDFFSSWTFIAAATAYRVLLGPAMASASSDDDTASELNLEKPTVSQDNNQDKFADSFKFWLFMMIGADVFFVLVCAGDLPVVLRVIPVLGAAILLQQALLIACLVLFSVVAFGDAVADYTIEGDRTAIDRRWNRQASQVQLATRGIYIWLTCMFATTAWLYFLQRKAA